MAIKKAFPQKLKNIYHLLQAVFANAWFGFPSRKLTVIGVTGTNGKTTTVQMVTKILEMEYGIGKVAMISTINFKLGDRTWVNATKFTTLSSWKVQSFLKKAVQIGCKYVVLEVSSHSIDQNRLWGIKFDTAVVTNITREHLDYHGDMENYRLCKLKMFLNAKAAVVNLDMEFPQDYLDSGAEEIYGYTTFESQNLNSKIKIIKAEDIELGVNYTKYKILDTKYSLNLIGRFNVENALAATCVGLIYGINLETAAKALGEIKGIPGRLERIENDRGLNIIVDYAVTPDSLEKLYTLINTIKCHSCENRNPANKLEDALLDSRLRGNDNRSKIIAVFGACGERDRGKRPIMGEIVAKYADYIILTNEDPYNEDPAKIVEEVAEGIKDKEEGENLWKIMDRRAAIKKALQIAKPGDYIIVTGKGAEVTMAVKEKRISWNDRKVILEELTS